jgi:uncharacterized protein (TIGR02246 family)
MKRLVATLWACTLVVSLAPAAWSAPLSAQETAARKAIDAGNHRYLAALVAGDAQGFADLYTVDGIQMPSSGAPIVHGRSALMAEAAAAAKTTRYLCGHNVTTSVAHIGALAYQTGRY